MRMIPTLLLCLPLGFATAAEVPAQPGRGKATENPLIDYSGFSKSAMVLEVQHANRTITEEDFIRMAKEPKTVILDARSKNRYDAIHIKGAIHLAFTDFTAESLKKAIPDPETRILIYCNNNFKGDPINLASKTARASLNVHTFVDLNNYGYKNVYQLGPLLDVNTTKIEFEGTNLPEKGPTK